MKKIEQGTLPEGFKVVDMRNNKNNHSVHVGIRVHDEIQRYAKKHNMRMSEVMRDAWDEFKRSGRI